MSESLAQGTVELEGWTFKSDFDSGNALCSSWTYHVNGEAVRTANGSKPMAPPLPDFEDETGEIKPSDPTMPGFSVQIAQDCHGQHIAKPKVFWFHFGVIPPDKTFSGEIKLSVFGMSQQVDLFSSGYRPWVSTPLQPRWHRVGGDVIAGPCDVGWQVVWTHQFDSGYGMTRFAFCQPYGYAEMMLWLKSLNSILGKELAPKSCLAPQPRSSILGRNEEEDKFLRHFNLGPPSSSSSSTSTSESARINRRKEQALNYLLFADLHDSVPHLGTGIYFHRQMITLSLGKRRVDVLTITAAEDGVGPNWPREELPTAVENNLRSQLPPNLQRSLPPTLPFRFPGRPICFFSGRVHPGETPGQFAINGLIQFLLSDDARAAVLRRHFVFKICPMLNPDGVAMGHTRTNSLGLDLNRCYRDPTPHQHEGVYVVKQLLLDWAARGELLLYVDCHAHAARRGCFLFGNHQGADSWSSVDALLWNLAYVYAIQMNTPHLDIDACEWSRLADGKKSKEKDEDDAAGEETSRGDSGRAQIGDCCKLYHAYTLECNYHISRTVRPVVDAPGLPDSAQKVQMLPGDINAGPTSRGGYGKRPPPMPYEHHAWAAVGEALAVALMDLHTVSQHSRLLVARPPKLFLPPDGDIAAALSGLDRLFDALAIRHSSVGKDTCENGTCQLVHRKLLRRRAFRVIHGPSVFLRSRPHRDAQPLGTKKENELVAILDVRKDGWVVVDQKEISTHMKNRGFTEGFMLIHGKDLGLGQLIVDSGELIEVEALPSTGECSDEISARLAPWVEDVENKLYPPAHPLASTGLL